MCGIPLSSVLGPFPLTRQLNSYCMVLVEGHCRWAEMVAIPGKESAITARVLLERVVGRYGCCAEVVSDAGGEFRGAFDALLSSLFIDHRTTSANHPQANGLAERAVQTLKRAIRKHSETAKEDSVWDMAVPYIMLGYNSSVQASTGLSPSEVMYGVPPTVPPAIRERYGGVIELDDPATAAAVVLRRAQALRECCIIAGDNILIAQHREPYDMPRCGVAVMPPASSTSSPRLLCICGVSLATRLSWRPGLRFSG